mmetsp:Transcript_7083/g.16200  ORF Transcript_7083/g.16200 Transcript_7083/m.16200 type:complete len:238 (+) Transcript_7083:3930-4643(+)
MRKNKITKVLATALHPRAWVRKCDLIASVNSWRSGEYLYTRAATPTPSASATPAAIAMRPVLKRCKVRTVESASAWGYAHTTSRSTQQGNRASCTSVTATVMSVSSKFPLRRPRSRTSRAVFRTMSSAAYATSTTTPHRLGSGPQWEEASTRPLVDITNTLPSLSLEVSRSALSSSLDRMRRSTRSRRKTCSDTSENSTQTTPSRCPLSPRTGDTRASAVSRSPPSRPVALSEKLKK